MSGRLLFRMVAPFAATSVLVFLLAGVAAWYVNRLQTDISDILTLNVASVRAAEELEIGLHEIRGHIKEYLHTGDREQLGAVSRLRQETDRRLRQAERLATTPHEQELIARVRQGYDRFLAEFDRLVLREVVDRLTEQELRVLTDQVLTREILPPAREYLELNEQMAARTTERNRVMAGRIMLLILFLGACGAGVGLLACYGMVRGIKRTIAQLSAPIRETAGKLNEVAASVPLAAGRDFEELESSLQRVAKQAGTVVARLHDSEREVLRSEQLAAVGQMAAGLAHELRNPLMAMKVLVQPAAEPGAAVSLSPEDLTVLNEEITRLDRSIQAFLDFARPPQPEKRPFEARVVVEQALHLVSGRAGQRGVRVECELPGEPVMIEADMVQVRQVLLNLLLNALDATPEGGTVRVELLSRECHDGPEEELPGREPCPGEWLTIRVADTGCGVPAELGQRIFEPFVSTKDTGMGLGLSICKRIVEAHGGQLAAAGRPGDGTVFTVRLPLHASPVAPGRPGT